MGQCCFWFRDQFLLEEIASSLRLELGTRRVVMPFRCCLWPVAVCFALFSRIIPNWISRLLLIRIHRAFGLGSLVTVRLGTAWADSWSRQQHKIYECGPPNCQLSELQGQTAKLRHSVEELLTTVRQQWLTPGFFSKRSFRQIKLYSAYQYHNFLFSESAAGGCVLYLTASTSELFITGSICSSRT